MERRNFLKRLAAGAAAVTLAPRAALARVVAPERTITVSGVPLDVSGRGPCVYQAHFQMVNGEGTCVVAFPEDVRIRHLTVRVAPAPHPFIQSVALVWMET
jgi:hypothetical protein